MIDIFSDEVIEYIDTVLNLSAGADCRFPYKNEVRGRMAMILMWREVNSELQKEIDNQIIGEMMKHIHDNPSKHAGFKTYTNTNVSKRRKRS